MGARLWVLLVALAAICSSSEATMKCEPVFLQDYTNNFFLYHKHADNPSLLCTATRVADMCGTKEAPATKAFGCGHSSCEMAFMERIVSNCGEWGLRLQYGKQFFNFDLKEKYSSNECLTNLHKSVSVNIHNAHAQNLYGFCNTARVEDYCGGPEEAPQKNLRVVIATLGCTMSDCAKLFYEHMLRGCGNWGSETKVSSEYRGDGQLGKCEDFAGSAINGILTGVADPCKDATESMVCGDENGSDMDQRRAAIFKSLGCSVEQCTGAFTEIMTSKCTQWSKKLTPTEDTPGGAHKKAQSEPLHEGSNDTVEPPRTSTVDLSERAATQRIRKVLQNSAHHIESVTSSYSDEDGDEDPGDY